MVTLMHIGILTKTLDGMTNTNIPGVSFSWKRAIGITKLKRQFTQATGIPTTKSGIERKIGAAVAGTIMKLFK
jgi:hypothetical protein